MRKHLRIISGKYKGRRLVLPSYLDIRPTKDKVREALFNIIGPSLENKSFLDLFAGSGAVGIEAISRGASCVFFVEKERKCIDLIRDNIKSLSIVSSLSSSLELSILQGDVFSILKKTKINKYFDYLFLDPPYNYDILSYKDIIHKLHPIILSPETTLIIEHPSKISMEKAADFISLIRTRKYGITSLSFCSLL